MHRVETASSRSPELDSEFESTFRAVLPNVTRSIDAAARLIETELPGWWWNCGRPSVPGGHVRWLGQAPPVRAAPRRLTDKHRKASGHSC